MNRAGFASMARPLLPTLLLVVAACGDGGETAENPGELAADAVPVTVEAARAEDIVVQLHSVGRLVSRNAPALAAEIDARVMEVLVEEGRQVSLGQALVRLDTTLFELQRREALADIQRLEASIANEQQRVDRYRGLREKEMIPLERLDDAEAALAADRASLAAASARLAIAQDRLSKALVTSPVDGTVERRHVSIGDYVKTGSPLLSLTDTVNLRAELPFPETVAYRLAEGQPLQLESPLAPGLLVEASVSQIRPEVGPLSRSIMVIADLVNPGGWRPEATVQGWVTVDRRADAVMVPLLSVVRRPDREVIYLLEVGEEGAKASEREVTTGVRKDGWVEIISTLIAGEIVIAEGAPYLSDGAPVSVRETAR